MPSRHAHRAALRRTKEPSCIPPPELPDLPALPPGCGWLNPVVGARFEREEWAIIRVTPAGGVRLATVRRDGTVFRVACSGASGGLEGEAAFVFPIAAQSVSSL
jgi:hypothetical protein